MTTIICPDDLIATVAALTLSIRVVGGAIGYTTYYNVLYSKALPLLTEAVVKASIEAGVFNLTVIEDIGSPASRVAQRGDFASCRRIRRSRI